TKTLLLFLFSSLIGLFSNPSKEDAVNPFQIHDSSLLPNGWSNNLVDIQAKEVDVWLSATLTFQSDKDEELNCVLPEKPKPFFFLHLFLNGLKIRLSKNQRYDSFFSLNGRYVFVDFRRIGDLVRTFAHGNHESYNPSDGFHPYLFAGNDVAKFSLVLNREQSGSALIKDSLTMILNVEYYNRVTYDLNKLVEYANNKEFTYDIVFHTSYREPRQCSLQVEVLVQLQVGNRLTNICFKDGVVQLQVGN
ncbi:hypothetical protein M8C21_013980, partial [Ambrosia artemisiifolia]